MNGSENRTQMDSGESDPVDPMDPTRMEPKIIMPRHVQMFEKQQQVRNTAKVNKQFKDNWSFHQT